MEDVSPRVAKVTQTVQQRDAGSRATKGASAETSVAAEGKEDVDYLLKLQLLEQRRQNQWHGAQNQRWRLAVVCLMGLFIVVWDGLAAWVLFPVFFPPADGGAAAIHPGIVIALIASCTFVTLGLSYGMARLLSSVKNGDKEDAPAVRMPAEEAGGHL